MARARRHVWSPQAVPIGLSILVLGLWAAAVPLVGPYFDFGFDTGKAWTFSQPHWLLSIVPGLAVAGGGLLLGTHRRGLGGPGALLAALGGAWLVTGLSFYPVFADAALEPASGVAWKRALLWVGYFYGVGGLALLLTGFARGLVTRRKRVEETLVAEPQFEQRVTEG